MPVTFTPGPHPSSSRRLSASSPYPGRETTTLGPTRHPLHKKSRKLNLAGSVPNGRSSPRPARGDDPFRDDNGQCHSEAHEHTEYCGHVLRSPEQESFPLHDDEGEAERQPLLGLDGERLPARRRGISVNAGAGILLALIVGAVIVFDVVRGYRRQPIEGDAN